MRRLAASSVHFAWWATIWRQLCVTFQAQKENRLRYRTGWGHWGSAFKKKKKGFQEFLTIADGVRIEGRWKKHIENVHPLQQSEWENQASPGSGHWMQGFKASKAFFVTGGKRVWGKYGLKFKKYQEWQRYKHVWSYKVAWPQPFFDCDVFLYKNVTHTVALGSVCASVYCRQVGHMPTPTHFWELRLQLGCLSNELLTLA